MGFSVRVDVTNPGQFFACCGLFELAARLDGDARASFEESRFVVDASCTLTELLDRWMAAVMTRTDPEDDTASPIHFDRPFHLVLDWWKDEAAGGRELKVWAGRMSSSRILGAMRNVLRDPRLHTDDIFDFGCVVRDPDDPAQKVEPFYFDARRTPNAHSRDVGFSPDKLELTTMAFPAVEALCLVGLQRCRPAATDHRRVFEYRAWSAPLPIAVVPPLICGVVPSFGAPTHRFENWFRTGQRKHKAFRRAVARGETE